MSEIDISTLSKSELKQLLQRSQQRLGRVKSKAEAPGIKSSDERVKAIAERVRDLSQELGLKRCDVLAAVAGNMRITVGTPTDGASTDRAVVPHESTAPAATTPTPSSTAKAQRGAKATKGKTPASAGRPRKAPKRSTGASKPRR